MGGHVSLSKNIRPPAKKENLSWGDAKTSLSPSDKYRMKVNVFYTCCLWVRTAAILFSISCSHYGFLHKLIKNNLFSAPITEQNCLFFINIATRQQFFKNVSKSTKNMLKQRLPNFFHHSVFCAMAPPLLTLPFSKKEQMVPSD